MTTQWNFADAFESIARAIPDAPCQIQGDRVLTWGEFDARANALAADLLAAGLTRHSKVAAYLYNCPEYLETYYAAFKGALVPVNTNFRYGPDELVYLWDNADAEAVVFHASFAPVIERIRGRLPKVRRWYAVQDGHEAPTWAVDYSHVVREGQRARPYMKWSRSGDDMLFLYTGGTTGMPKGVMWRQDDLFNIFGGGGNPTTGIPPITRMEELGERVAAAAQGARPVHLPACPLMHGTGQFGAMIYMMQGGCVVSLPSRKFSAVELWQTVSERKVTVISIVGDAFGRPMLEELDANANSYALDSVLGVTSSGVMWSQEIKRGLLRHLPKATLSDSFGSSEAVGLGGSASTAANAEQTARFIPGPQVKLLDDTTWKPVGPGERGIVALAGLLPMGYYKDQEKTDKTFKTIDGVRYSIPGDYAQWNADGTITLLGRGSVCINTGGEKVFPEEVEEVLKRHPSIADAVCVGVPDQRFGQAICAVIELAPGATELGNDDTSTHVREHLAAYKSPRFTVAVPSIGRAPNGKVDYKGLTQLARERLRL